MPGCEQSAVRMGPATRRGALAVPILLRFTRHCWRGRVLDLQPAVSAPGAVRRAQTLRHDALAAERTSLAVDDRAIRDKCALNTMPAGLPRSSDLRVLLRISSGSRRKSSPSSSSRSKAQRTAVALDRCPRMRSKTASPFWSVTIASPSMRQERAGSTATAAAASGKRPNRGRYA